MSSARPNQVVRHASHGVVSFTAGFCTGFLFFLALGAATDDAIFSALALALIVAVSRELATWTPTTRTRLESKR